MQASEPASAYDPFSHGTQAPSPAGLAEPASHWVQRAAPAELVKPAAQGVHDASPSELNVPVGHSLQVELAGLAVNAPALQGNCAVAPSSSTKNPAFALRRLAGGGEGPLSTGSAIRLALAPRLSGRAIEAERGAGVEGLARGARFAVGREGGGELARGTERSIPLLVGLPAFVSRQRGLARAVA